MVSKDFLNCRICDFEWHRKDGEQCPVCATKTNEEEVSEYQAGGLFGTGEKAGRVSLYYQAIGLLALVYFLYFIFGN